MLRTVRTENGWVKGIEAADPRITAFKGIPFAAPPVGENRWRAPQPCEDWDGVRECYRFAPISMQSVPGIGDNVYIREWHVDPEIAMDNEGLFHRAVVMSAMIRSPYQVGGIGVPEELWHAEENGQHFLSFLGCSTIEQARKLDAATIRDKYEEYTKIFPAMFTVLDHKFCVGDPMVLFMEGKHVNVPVMSGNTSDEFPSYIEASSKEDLKKKAEEIFGKNAETFLRFPEAMREDSDGKYAKVNGIECTIKCLFSDKKSAGEKKPYYYYRFDSDIPGWDNAGTFHSVDLWRNVGDPLWGSITIFPE